MSRPRGTSIPEVDSAAADTVEDFPSLPGYEFVCRLGSGGMGEVFLARQAETRRPVAIKFLNLPKSDGTRELGGRFDREAGLMAQFRHPNIVQVLERGVEKGRPYLMMEFVEGGNLRSVMLPHQPTPIVKVRAVLSQVSKALTALQEVGVVHRDLKPENILLDRDGNVKITDFGIAVAEADVGQLTQTSQILGTFDYMAPEQRARLPVDARADQFALAVIAYELLTGRKPLGSFKPPSLHNRELHSAVDAVVARALREEPDERYPEAAAFAGALDQALAMRSRRGLRPIAWACGATLVAAMVVGGVLAFRPERNTPVSVGSEMIALLARTEIPSTSLPAPPPDQSEKALYFLKRGDQHLEDGRDSEAESSYTEAIRLSPRDPRPYLKRAFVFKKNRVYQKALDDLKAVLDLDRSSLEAWTGVGSIYVQLGDFAKAIPELDQAINLDSRCAEALAWRGWAKYKLGEKELARQDLDAALRADGNCFLAYHYRAMFNVGEREPRRAKADFEQAIRCDAENPFAHQGLALLLANWTGASIQDRRNAVEHARKACELTQWRSWQHIRTLATASAAIDDLDAAIKWCEKAVELAPEISRGNLQKQLESYRKRWAAKKDAP